MQLLLILRVLYKSFGKKTYIDEGKDIFLAQISCRRTVQKLAEMLFEGKFVSLQKVIFLNDRP